MSLFSKLFGSTKSPEPAACETHAGFTITPNPQKEQGGYRIGARIEKDGKSHQMIRADVVSALDEAVKTSVTKAKVLIDQQGDGIF